MGAQERMIERVREACRADERLEAAMLYGAWARGEGDAYSDIDVVLFFRDDALEGLDRAEWLGQIAPVELVFTNEFGHTAAIFATLVRGEFHFDRASEVAAVETWAETDTFPSLECTLILDRTGRLTRHLGALVRPAPERDTPERVRFLCDSFLNWILFGDTVLRRGEVARSLEILGTVHRYLLWMVRLAEERTAHWPTPSKSFEADISPAANARYAACTAPAEPAALARAYRAAWVWGRELMPVLAERHGLALPEGLVGKLDARIGRPVSPDGGGGAG